MNGELLAAVQADDRPAIAMCLDAGSVDLEPENEHVQPILARARSVATAELLLAHGARLEPVANWWQRGFGVITGMTPDVGRYLAMRGAALTPHAAAGLGLVAELNALLAADANLVHQPGGDGCHPLHFARSPDIVDLLLDHGADPNVRDEDHSSTPMQWLLKDAPAAARRLVERGAEADIFSLLALGETDRARRLVEERPDCVEKRIGEAPFLIYGHEGKGGSILQWTVGFHSYPHQVAARLGETTLVDAMFAASSPRTRLLAACLCGRREDAMTAVRDHPGVLDQCNEEDRRLVAYYSWETNNDLAAVRALLDVGFPVEVVEPRHGFMPLHNAAWCGNAELVDLLLSRGHRVDREHPDHGDALQFAHYSALHVRGHPEGRHDRVFASLIDAGCNWDPIMFPTGNRAIDDVLRRRMKDRLDGSALLGDAEAVEAQLGNTPDDDALAVALIAAAKGGHIDIVSRLLDRGAEIRLAGPSRTTALHQAIVGGSIAVAKLLFERGADPDLRNGHGSTVMVSCVWGDASAELIDLALSHGVDINTPTNRGMTPLAIAREHGFDRVAGLLATRGAC